MEDRNRWGEKRARTDVHGAQRQDKRVDGRRNTRTVHLTTVHHPFDPRIFHKQLKTLRAAGYDAHLIAPHPESETVDGIPITALPSVTGRYRRMALQRPAYRAACQLGADVYHIHDPELIPLAYMLKRTVGARVIYDMHEDYRTHGPVEGRLLRTLERWAFRWIDHVILAESSYRPIVAQSEGAATFIGNYMRPYDCTPPPRNAELSPPLRLLYTGVVAESRGLTAMIELVGRLRAAGTDVRLDLVGVCNYPEQRRRAACRIRQGALENFIRRVGWNAYVPASAMTPYYRTADVGLALFEPEPNYVRSMPTKFYEYLHYGLPIICSDFPRWRAFIERHGCGAVVPPGDIEAALAVLRRWHDNPDRYRARSEAAREAAPEYRWELMGKQLVRVYDTLLGGAAVTG